MTFKNCIENFPIHDTLVGRYDSEQTFTITDPHSIDHIEKWDDNPFWEDNSCYSFVVFEPQEKKFRCWSFIFSRVSGYINETEDFEEFYPASYSEDFGWEKIDPFDPNLEDQVTLPDDELAIELGWPLAKYREDKWRREQVAYLFDAESYLNGFTFTSLDALKNFCMERKDLL